MEERYAADWKAHVETFGVAVARVDERLPYVVSLGNNSLLPSDEELAVLKSYRDYIISRVYTNPSYAAKLLAMPLPYDDGHNTTTFHFGLNGDAAKGWFYSKLTWSQPRWPNPVAKGFRPLRLEEVLDQIEDGSAWEAWQEAHPEFSALAAVDGRWTPSPLGRRHRHSPLAAWA